MTQRMIFALSFLIVAPACVVEAPPSGEEPASGDDPARSVAAACDTMGWTQSCVVEETGDEGYQECVAMGLGLAWNSCRPVPQCEEMYRWDGGCCADEYNCCAGDLDCETPLVLSFDGAPVRYTSAMHGSFDLTGAGMTIASDWPTAATPWLVLDRDGNGSIDDGGELFGSATRLASGAFAGNGFAALAELDDNGDGRISPADDAWAALAVWRDNDSSRSSTPGELEPLTETRLLWIDLAYTVSPRCDDRGNCERERARFGYRDGDVTREGAIVDVHLAMRRL